MYYTDYPDHGHSIFLARSRDGVNWSEYGKVLGVQPLPDENDVEVGGIIKENPWWYMYYSYRTKAGAILPGIRVAWSLDGMNWTPKADPVVKVGIDGTYDSVHIEGAQAFKLGGRYVLFYSAYDGSHYVSALASSASPTSSFVKSELNPVFLPSERADAWDHEHVSTSVIAGISGRNYIYYQGTNFPGANYSDAIWDMGAAVLGNPPTVSSAAFTNGDFGYNLSPGQYEYRPTGFTGWNFEGNAGIQADGSPFSGKIKSKNGTTAFLQTKGTSTQDSAIAQDVNFPSAGAYLISFKAAQRVYNSQFQTFAVQVDGVTYATCRPLMAWSLYTYSKRVAIASAGIHRIRLLSTTPYGSDATALIDDIGIYKL